MATLTVRKLDDEVYRRLSQQAKRNNRSLEAEARAVLAEAAREFDLARWMDDLQDRQTADPVTLPDGKTSLDILRDERASW